MNRQPCPAPPWPPRAAALNTSAVPSPDGAGTAAPADIEPLAKETSVMPDSTDTRTGTHRPITLRYSTPHVSVVPEAIADRPKVSVFINASTLTASATITAGPMRIKLPDAETARFWLSALEELAAQLSIAEADAEGLRNTEMRAASDYYVVDDAEYERQDHADDAALDANAELERTEA